MTDNSLLSDLEARGLVAQMSSGEDLASHLAQPRCVYSGFDPTADSLHIGHLIPLLTLRRFQLAGHRPLALVGGATGLIGDPSFKAAERQLNTPDVVAGWVERLRTQLSRFVDFDCGSHSAEVVNNLDWFEGFSALDFLRDVGKHFSVNSMIQKESVKQRIERDGSGISFTEFSYMLLQSYDFAELYRRHDCTVQIGGSDQWGNITGGIDLTRRLHRAQAYGLTLPLATKADGTKFGKTESGAVWLDAAKTSPYTFYQFWLNCADADVYKFLYYYTLLSPQAIAAQQIEDETSGGRPQAQQLLACEVTRLVHGEAELEAAQRITRCLFDGTLEQMTAGDLAQLQLDGLPATVLDADHLAEGQSLTGLLSAELGVKGGQVKDALSRDSVIVNGRAVGLAENMAVSGVFSAQAALHGRYFILRLGKKRFHLFSLAG